MAKDITIKAVINYQDGSLFFRQETTRTNCTPEVEEVLYGMLGKQKQFLDDLKANQKKEPDAIFKAILSATDEPDLHYDAFTFDSFQKAYHNWNKLGEEVLRIEEKRIKGRGKP